MTFKSITIFAMTGWNTRQHEQVCRIITRSIVLPDGTRRLVSVGKLGGLRWRDHADQRRLWTIAEPVNFDSKSSRAIELMGSDQGMVLTTYATSARFGSNDKDQQAATMRFERRILERKTCCTC
jgi:hypothetical protein